MRNEYGKNYYVVKASQVEKHFDDNGFSRTELLPGVYDGGVRSYKCSLKAGCKTSPKLYKDKGAVISFDQDKEVLKDKRGEHTITELVFYVPDLDKDTYEIRAEEEMEFVINVIESNQWDWEGFRAWRTGPLYFRLHNQCASYIQDCKGPNTEARMVLCPKWFGRVSIGIIKADGEGTVEKGHFAIRQWNYCVDSSDFTMSAGYKDQNNMENVNHKANNRSFTPTGADHDPVSESGKEVCYVWFKYFTDERKFAKSED